MLFLRLCRCNSWNDTWPSWSLCHECSTEVCAEIVWELCNQFCYCQRQTKSFLFGSNGLLSR